MPYSLPDDEGRLPEWLDNFVARLTEHAGTLGLDDGEVRAVSADSNTLSHLIRHADRAKPDEPRHPEAYRQLYAFKDLMKNGPSDALRTTFPDALTPLVMSTAPGVLPRLIDLVQSIRGSSGFTPEIGRALDVADTGVPAADRIPTGDNELLSWMKKFLAALKPHAAALGLGDATLNGLQNDHDALDHLVAHVDRALNDGRATPVFRELVDYKDFIKYGLTEKVASAFPAAALPAATAVAPGILPRLRGFLDTLTARPGYTSAIAAALGLAAVPAFATATVEQRREEVVPIAAAARPVTAAAPVAVAETGGNRWLAPLIGLLALFGLGWLLWPKGGPTMPVASPTPVAAASVAAAPVTEATPAPLAAVLAERKADDVLMLYERGAAGWIEPAADEFNKTQEKGRIVLTSLGSREGRDHILYDKEKVQPVLWNPGDIYWVDKLQADAANANLPAKSGATVDEGKALLKTNVVLIMKADRAKAFEAAMQKPQYRGKTWSLLRTAAEKGWSAIGGPAGAGNLKLAHSNPALSNSGMMTLALMYAEFQRNNPGKDFNSAEFKAAMSALESSAGGTFADTTADVMEAVRSDKADVAVVYEADAVRALENGDAAGFRIVYPSPTAEVILPAAIVEGKWVSEHQKKLASTFVDYLLSAPVQEQAIERGYRPAIPTLASDVDAFYDASVRKDAGMQRNPDAKGAEVDSKAKEALIFNWVTWYKAKYGKDPMQGSG